MTPAKTIALACFSILSAAAYLLKIKKEDKNKKNVEVVVVDRFNSKNLTAAADLFFFTTYTKSNYTCKYK